MPQKIEKNSSKVSLSRKDDSFSKEKSSIYKSNKIQTKHTKNVKSINTFSNKLKLDLILKKTSYQNKSINKREKNKITKKIKLKKINISYKNI